MDYVYHMIPKKMTGEVLISLNEIKLIDSELYKTYSKKYSDHPERPSLFLKRIPKLNCLWNDVIFLLPLHPYYVYEALYSLGLSIKKDLMFYEIPTERLMKNKNGVYFYNKENYRGPASDIPDEEIQVIDIISYPECSALPSDALAYFTEQHKKGVNFGMFAHIPHILSLGNINIKGVNMINWSAAPVQI
ncbi:group-specific protein [Lysinibacillus sp. Ag94]|uniref:group-specific protein n=1 Tax=Lysinibacillus sp. Ag94 TaxID=2936682 RepID=UPI00200E294E|nr:group-specific protein [Lysinibacillus sp. Ag94]UPW83858.1 group-specific protein [Lysinibacillus sp. Ag94]